MGAIAQNREARAGGGDEVRGDLGAERILEGTPNDDGHDFTR